MDTSLVTLDPKAEPWLPAEVQTFSSDLRASICRNFSGCGCPVVNGGSDLELGYPVIPDRFPKKEWGASWSYLEFSN